MFFIHGGGLFSGSGAQYDGRALAAMGNIVVVIINYRLGILGFSGIGGQWNVGFLDQISALRWVQHNIHVFGGDPGRVTIAGQSAGGGSVGWLVLSPLTAGLFRRAISQSGAATTIPTQNTDYTMHPRTLLKNGSARNIEYLMGVTNHELGHAISQDWDFSGEEDRDQIRSIIKAGYRDYFQFQHRPSWHHSKPGHVKADHGDELLFVFGAPFFDWPRNPADPAWRLNFTEEERVLSRKIMTYWTNFVKTG
uniref:Carboxylic ester hydrolase n=1 Tax=Branchiostoma floridae TaxID=7739 RepID=C3XQ93_BRAFL|eukprot:XP_002614105.1 hypothetical protein BRAFLDRAFT_245503 [Branchiostoma floridae]